MNEARFPTVDASISSLKTFFEKIQQNPPKMAPSKTPSKPPPQPLPPPPNPSPLKRKQNVQESVKKKNKSTLDNFFTKKIESKEEEVEDDQEPITEKDFLGKEM